MRELPDVRPFADYLAERFCASHVALLADQDVEPAVHRGSRPTLLIDPGGPAPPELSDTVLLADPWIEADPDVALGTVARAMDEAKAGVLFAREPARIPAPGAIAALRRHGMSVAFSGHTRDSTQPDATRDAEVFLIENNRQPIETTGAAPGRFDVVAFVIVYNEEDVIVPTLLDLFENGVEAYVIDNWSSDRTYDLAREFVGRGVLGIERSPTEGPPKYFDLRALLTRVEQLTKDLGADWYIKHDADEIRRPPWPDLRLKDAIWSVDRAGYNCIDFTVLNFRPTDDSYRAGDDLVDHFRTFEFGRNPGHFRQLKAWKDFGQDIDYARFGSHRIEFPGLAVFPYKFLLRHYPIRSQAHGEKKVFNERKARFLPEARKRGWHKQYDDVAQGQSFLREPDELLEYIDGEFEDRYLIERLSGVGIERLDG